MSQIKAIETRYAGCHFRSRLEARWAVFFDHLGIEWQYEPQGFAWEAGTHVDQWGNEEKMEGGMYLPDFWLPSIQTWYEVKGEEPTDKENRIHWEFVVVSGKRHITAFGDIPSNPGYWFDTDSMILNGCQDYSYTWCLCPFCGKAGIEFNGRGARVCGVDHSCVGKCTGDDCSIKPIMPFSGRWDDKGYTYSNPKILAAYEAARSARFEHGQSGAQ